MKDSSLIPLLQLLSFVVLSVTGCSPNPRNADGTLLGGVGDAIKAKILLTELRAGRVTNVTELLEREIDSSIITIDVTLASGNEFERELALDTLQTLNEYREEHPRRHEAVIPDDTWFEPYTPDMIQRASNILGELK